MLHFYPAKEIVHQCGSAAVAQAPTAKFQARVTGIADKLEQAASCRRLNGAQTQ